MQSNGTDTRKETPVAKGSNSPFIVVRTQSGTVKRPNPNYVPPKKGILASIFGK